MRLKDPSQLPDGVMQRQQLEQMFLDQEAHEKALDPTLQKAKPRSFPEAELQKECISTARDWPMRLLLGPSWRTHEWTELLNDALGSWIYHTPSGGWRSGTEAQIFMGMGVMPGVWDLFCFVPVRHPTAEYHGLYQELKVDDNELTENQIDFRRRAELVGFKCDEVRSGREFQQSIENYFIGSAPYERRR